MNTRTVNIDPPAGQSARPAVATTEPATLPEPEPAPFDDGRPPLADVARAAVERDAKDGTDMRKAVDE